MPRGFKKDVMATRERKFLDKRSFVSMQKIIAGECETAEPHVILYGKDKEPMRAVIFSANAKVHGGDLHCWMCGNRLGSEVGEWDHIRNKPGQRCDCESNGAVSCKRCHRAKHVKPMWGKDAGKRPALA